jgi:hypothetical protein
MAMIEVVALVVAEIDNFTFYILYVLFDMSKNQDRYKEDYLDKNIEELDELDTEKFEKFNSKKKDKKKSLNTGSKKDDE